MACPNGSCSIPSRGSNMARRNYGTPSNYDYDYDNSSTNKSKSFLTKGKEFLFGAPDERVRENLLQGPTMQLQREFPDQIRQLLPLLQQLGMGSFDQAGQIQQQALMPRQVDFNFEPIAAQARENFQTQTIPSIAERFGELGGQSKYSTASRAAVAGAGSKLERDLAALSQEYALKRGTLEEEQRRGTIQGLGTAANVYQGGVGNLQNLLTALLGGAFQQPYGYGVNQGSPGVVGSLAKGAGKFAGAAAGAYFNPIGTAASGVGSIAKGVSNA